MMKRTLRIALTPFMLIARLVLGLAAFISSIAYQLLRPRLLWPESA